MSQIQEWINQPRNAIIAAVAVVAAIVGGTMYSRVDRQKTVTANIAQATSIARDKIAPLIKQFEAQNHRLPVNNAELQLPSVHDASWKPLTIVDVRPEGSVYFEFADSDGGNDSDPAFSYRLKDSPSGRANTCGAQRVLQSALAANQLSCDENVGQPPRPRSVAGVLAVAAAEAEQAGRAAAIKIAGTAADRVIAAISSDDVATLQQLKASGIDICAADSGGRLPLADAARNNELKALAALAAAPCNLQQIESFSQRTALMIAVMLRNVDATNVLLGAGADPNFATPAGVAPWLLLGDGEDGPSTQLRQSLQQHKVNVDTADANGATLLMTAADKNSGELATWLLTNGANPNMQDKAGRTALMRATLNANGKTMMNLLLSNKADPNLRDAEGHSALALARLITDQKRQKDISRLLMAAGAKN